VNFISRSPRVVREDPVLLGLRPEEGTCSLRRY